MTIPSLLPLPLLDVCLSAQCRTALIAGNHLYDCYELRVSHGMKLMELRTRRATTDPRVHALFSIVATPQVSPLEPVHHRHAVIACLSNQLGGRNWIININSRSSGMPISRTSTDHADDKQSALVWLVWDTEDCLMIPPRNSRILGRREVAADVNKSHRTTGSQ